VTELLAAGERVTTKVAALVPELPSATDTSAMDSIGWLPSSLTMVAVP
jgi:hypothetical protein